jgi:hypothetical protein
VLAQCIDPLVDIRQLISDDEDSHELIHSDFFLL